MGFFRKQVIHHVDAISCDNVGCSSCFEEDEDERDLTVQTQAIMSGWDFVDGKWACPACAAKKGQG